MRSIVIRISHRDEKDKKDKRDERDKRDKREGSTRRESY